MSLITSDNFQTRQLKILTESSRIFELSFFFFFLFIFCAYVRACLCVCVCVCLWKQRIFQLFLKAEDEKRLLQEEVSEQRIREARVVTKRGLPSGGEVSD